MPEEVKEQEQATEEAETATEETTDTEAELAKWKAYARDWEKKAKANKGAADELEKLKDAQLSETERLTKRAETAEAKLKELMADKARMEAATKVAAETGLTVAQVLMLNGKDADELVEQARAFASDKSAFAPTHDKGDGGHTHSKTTAEEFGDWFNKQLR
jgi:chromosome segregation ATPase